MFIVLLTTYTLVVSPDAGKLNGAITPIASIPIVEIARAPPVGTVKVTASLVSNG